MTRRGDVLDSGTLGDSRRRVSADGLVLTETTHAAGTTIGSHAHARAGINFVLAGRYGEETRGRFLSHPPATLIIKPAGEPHVNRFEDRGAHCLLMEFDSSVLERLGARAQVLSQPQVLPMGPLAGFVSQLIRVLRADIPPVAAQEVAFECLGHIGIRQRAAPERGRPGWLLRVRDRIHASAPARLSLDELASEAGVHPAYLSETFHQVYGTTITCYVERLRLDRAVAALAATDEQVGRIALRAGFYDHSHFSRVFRRATGVTPSAFRRSLRS